MSIDVPVWRSLDPAALVLAAAAIVAIFRFKVPVIALLLAAALAGVAWVSLPPF